MKEKIKQFLKEVLENEDHEATWFFDLDIVNGKRWALVATWMNYDGDDNWKVYAKLAYQPTNYLLQEYDIDWLMPISKDGDVDDTELYVGSKVNETDIDWWLKEWEYFKKEYVYKEDEENG